jgi:uracil phosphoribosyltransferase
MVRNLSNTYSIVSDWISELRDVQLQADRMRFRRNLERVGELAALEISTKLKYHDKEIQTPLGIATCKTLTDQPILATILRAGLPLHNGLLNVFDKADNAFISASRKHRHDGSFDISLEYISCPDLDDRVLILSDPMIATGSSCVKTLQFLREEGRPREIHIVSAIACTVGIEFIKRAEPSVTIWCGDIDEELTAKGYIVPGLGDAGDLAYGPKVQA